ncbi:MAG TPA: hypothetical protein PLO86_08465 [Syntrophales bacterium]|nr:hypothetical protein [Syntrophales bacterium]HQB30788.1 hypothetical protein [Syntrophales bacterium]
MTFKRYRIRKAFLVPLGVDTVLLFLLIVLSLLTPGHPAERIVFVLLFLPLAYLLLEMISRSTVTGPGGIEMKKLLRRKSLSWEDITSVDTVVLGKKAYVTLSTKKGFYALSNAHEHFTDLIRDIVERTEKEKIEKRVFDLIEQDIRRRSDIFGAWIAAVLLGMVLYIRIFPGG